MTPKIETRLVADLIPYAANSRTHSDAQVAQIAASIKEFGWTNPILVAGDDTIIAGHGRLLAARKLALVEVPAIVLDHLSKSQQRALVIADNQLALNAGWNMDMLKAEIEDLQLDDFDLNILGFDDKFLDGLLEPEPTAGLTDEDAVPEIPETPKTVLGDVWVLGNHRLMCGDSTSIDALEKLTEGRLVDMWLTDPPYNVAYEGKTKDALTIQNDSMTDDSFRAFLRDAYIAADAVMKAGAVFYIWHVWATDRKQTTILEFDKPSRNGEHPTMKPVELFEYQMLNNTKGSDIVLDSFGGSGTTIIAAEKHGRHGRIMELDPKYCDVIIKRWQDFTGKEAIHAETGETFNGSR